MKLQIVYHGTNQVAAESILHEGFRTGTWFARHLEDALTFGGLHVFEVVAETDKISGNNWQFTITHPWVPTKIVGYKIYMINAQIDNKEIRERIFHSNLGDYEEKE